MRGWAEASPSHQGVGRRMEVVGSTASSLLQPDQGLLQWWDSPAVVLPLFHWMRGEELLSALKLWANSDTEYLLAKALQGGQAKDSCQGKRAHGSFPQLPLHFQGLNRVFMVLLQELIKHGSILLQVVFSLFQFSFFILCYVLHPLNLVSLYCDGILKWAQKATQSYQLVDFKGILV